MPPVLVRLDKTCNAFPAQWEAETPDGGRVYVRLRCGVFRWGSGVDVHEAVEDSEHQWLRAVLHGREYWGDMRTGEMLELLQAYWPEWRGVQLVDPLVGLDR